MAQIYKLPTEKPQPDIDWHTISAERNRAISKRAWRKITDHPLIMTWVGLLAGFGLLELVLLAWRWFV